MHIPRRARILRTLRQLPVLHVICRQKSINFPYLASKSLSIVTIVCKHSPTSALYLVFGALYAPNRRLWPLVFTECECHLSRIFFDCQGLCALAFFCFFACRMDQRRLRPDMAASLREGAVSALDPTPGSKKSRPYSPALPARLVHGRTAFASQVCRDGSGGLSGILFAHASAAFVRRLFCAATASPQAISVFGACLLRVAARPSPSTAFSFLVLIQQESAPCL